MCGRYSNTLSPKKIAQELGIDIKEVPPLKPRYNIAPSDPVACLVKNSKLKVDIFVWGLIPSWAKDLAIGNQMINVRAETVAEKPSFKGPFKNKRCLVLADGFYEWKKQGKYKTPYYFRLKSGNLIGFAGIWSDWMSKEGSEIKSCAIITGEPNDLVREVHERMPVIIPRKEFDTWLDCSSYDAKRLQALLKPYPRDEMEAFPVSQLVNDPKNDIPDCRLALRN